MQGRSPRSVSSKEEGNSKEGDPMTSVYQWLVFRSRRTMLDTHILLCIGTIVNDIESLVVEAGDCARQYIYIYTHTRNKRRKKSKQVQQT